MSIGFKFGVECESLPRSSADLDHGLRERLRRSPSPRGGVLCEGEDGPCNETVLGDSRPFAVRASERSSTELLLSERKARSEHVKTHRLPAPERLLNDDGGSGRSWSKMGLGSVGCEILGLRPELVLDRGSTELIDARPGSDPLEFERLNHLVGLDRKDVNPFEGDAERGKLSEPLGERAPCVGSPASGGLNVLTDGTARRGAMNGGR